MEPGSILQNAVERIPLVDHEGKSGSAGRVAGGCSTRSPPCTGCSSATLGWNKALDAAEHPDPEIRERERQDLDWWVGEGRRALESGLL